MHNTTGCPEVHWQWMCILQQFHSLMILQLQEIMDTILFRDMLETIQVLLWFVAVIIILMLLKTLKLQLNIVSLTILPVGQLTMNQILH